MDKPRIFICPGASKAGTTTLFDILKGHPEINLSNIKETNFFVKEELFEKGIEFYLNAYFENGNRLLGEICPQYMSSNLVAKRISNLFGHDVKLIFMLRNPVDRLISHYNMKTRTFENECLENVVTRLLKNVNDFDPRMKSCIIKNLEYDYYESINKNDLFQLDAYRYSRYVFPGLYADIIEDYLKYFSISNMKFVVFEEFVNNLRPEIEQILEFLGVDSNWEFETGQKSNSKKVYKSKLAKKMRNTSLLLPMDLKMKLKTAIGTNNYDKIKRIVERPFIDKNPEKTDYKLKLKIKDFYLSQVKQLEILINRDLSIWK